MPALTAEERTPIQDTSNVLTPGLVLLMAITCGLTVANMYYCQPLLTQMDQSFPGRSDLIRYIPTFSQLGTMIGMFAFVPLGDMFERRRLTVLVTLANAVAVLAMAIAQNSIWLCAASFGVGLLSVVPHLLLPFAAHLSSAQSRGRVVGTLLSGLLIGVLLARTLSGLIGAEYGWRAVYYLAAALMLVLALILQRRLPLSPATSTLRYGQLLGSIFALVRQQPVLREASLIGGLLFGSLSAFWATLVFRLATPPFHYGARMAGLFGIIGAAGAAAAPLAGRLADRKGARYNISLALAVSLIGFAIFWGTGSYLWGLIAGTILVDLGVQAGHVSNQTRLYSILPEARSRLNTVYMVSYFLGGAIGSALGAYGWQKLGWAGVCLTGIGMLLLAVLVHAFGTKTIADAKPVSALTSPDDVVAH